eukprot:1877509-Rhodomonas_salina.1
MLTFEISDEDDPARAKRAAERRRLQELYGFVDHVQVNSSKRQQTIEENETFEHQQQTMMLAIEQQTTTTEPQRSVAVRKQDSLKLDLQEVQQGGDHDDIPPLCSIKAFSASTPPHLPSLKYNDIVPASDERMRVATIEQQATSTEPVRSVVVRKQNSLKRDLHEVQQGSDHGDIPSDVPSLPATQAISPSTPLSTKAISPSTPLHLTPSKQVEVRLHLSPSKHDDGVPASDERQRVAFAGSIEELKVREGVSKILAIAQRLGHGQLDWEDTTIMNTGHNHHEPSAATHGQNAGEREASLSDRLRQLEEESDLISESEPNRAIRPILDVEDADDMGWRLERLPTTLPVQVPKLNLDAIQTSPVLGLTLGAEQTSGTHTPSGWSHISGAGEGADNSSNLGYEETFRSEEDSMERLTFRAEGGNSDLSRGLHASASALNSKWVTPLDETSSGVFTNVAVDLKARRSTGMQPNLGRVSTMPSSSSMPAPPLDDGDQQTSPGVWCSDAKLLAEALARRLYPQSTQMPSPEALRGPTCHQNAPEQKHVISPAVAIDRSFYSMTNSSVEAGPSAERSHGVQVDREKSAGLLNTFLPAPSRHDWLPLRDEDSRSTSTVDNDNHVLPGPRRQIHFTLPETTQVYSADKVPAHLHAMSSPESSLAHPEYDGGFRSEQLKAKGSLGVDSGLGLYSSASESARVFTRMPGAV